MSLPAIWVTQSFGDDMDSWTRCDLLTPKEFSRRAHAQPLAIVLLLALLYDRYGSLPVAQSMLRGIAAAGCGLLLAMAWRMGMAIRDKPVFLPFTVLTVAAVAWLRWPLPAVMAAGLALSGSVAWWKLGRK